MTRIHAGTVLNDADAQGLAALGRGTCRACGFIRPRRSKQCSPCGLTNVARAVVEGDMIYPSTAAVSQYLENVSADAPSNEPGPASGAVPGVGGPEVDVQNGENGEQAAIDARDNVSAAGASTTPASNNASSAPVQGRARRHRRHWVRVDGRFSFREGHREPVTRQHRGATPSLPPNFLT